MNRDELRSELINLLRGCPQRPRYSTEELVDTLILGISDDLCKRLTNSTMVLKTQVVNLANGNDVRMRNAALEAAQEERERCANILVEKYKWTKKNAHKCFEPKESE